MQATRRNSESGNAFYIILLGVLLFAALMFTFSKGARQGAGNMSNRQVKLAVSDTMDYAQELERAVERITANGVSESDLCFHSEVWGNTTYNYASCADPKNMVFDAGGGAATARAPDPGLGGSGLVWTFNGAQSFVGVGSDCTNSQSCKDLAATVTGISKQACVEINNQLNITNPSGAPPDQAQIAVHDPFKGTFASADNHLGAAQLTGKTSGCYHETNSGDYIFYHVLIAR